MTTSKQNSQPRPEQIHTLLVANRGEIAVRIMQSAKRLGIRTVAVFSEVDVNALHVAVADEAILIGSAQANESYLKIESVIAAAQRSGANAIHPGYGFLSENPDFVEACDKANIIFVGPDASAMRSMGLKDAAKALMESAGVPVVPGYHGDNQDEKFLAEQANAIGYPVLIKARAGGGGKGMRKVERAEDFVSDLQAAQREGQSSFGDASVLIEKYIKHPRHIEVQVFGDRHGNTVHLFERDCSLQRRHQKVIEEAPAPGMTDEVRQSMTSAAIRTAQSINYVGAGTVEFIVDASGPLRSDGFWFMEMNTRLQVEHPVTEAVTGFDLVEWQLLVAAGQPLPVQQEQITLNGHAVEARLYAEDVDAGFLPATGVLKRFSMSDLGRVDSGVVEGDAVLPYYDPMLAKLIAHAPNREQAFSQLQRSLTDSVVLGVTTNRAFLARLCVHTDVLDGDVHTGLIEQGVPQNKGDATELVPHVAVERECNVAIAAILVASKGFGGAADANNKSSSNSFRNSDSDNHDSAFGRDNASVFQSLGLWQLWESPRREVTLLTRLQHNAQGSPELLQLSVQKKSTTQWHVSLNDRYINDESNESNVKELTQLAQAGITVELISTDKLSVGLPVSFTSQVNDRITDQNNGQTHFVIAVGDMSQTVNNAIHSRVGSLEMVFEAPAVEIDGNASANSAQLVAPMPGRIIAVGVAEGDSVSEGDVLVTLEAMKMEHTLVADSDTTIEAVQVVVGDQVEQGAQLVVFKTDSA